MNEDIVVEDIEMVLWLRLKVLRLFIRLFYFYEIYVINVEIQL